MGERIYVADDEQHIRVMMQSFLENEGYEVETFADGYSVSRAVEKQEPDLLILDIMMPGEDGLSICSRLRKKSAVPILIVSARDSSLDKVTGLLMGSDDYIVKPFLPLEFLARVKALLRRAGLRENRPEAEPVSCGNLTLWPGLRLARVSGETLVLTPLEFDFLLYLARRKETAVERGELFREVWKYSDAQPGDRLSDDLVKRLRKKLRAAHASALVTTVWGYGYRLTEGGMEP